ncbi:MAG: deoxyguanosinetriphosphate triphosphohydrolase [Ignavibacteriaceae bacterium]
MDWKKLLSRSQLGEEKILSKNNPDGRSEFQRDFDRVVFSSAFRRLQDKTQVFPLPESDFVHNRLTHSLEVSCVGRSLGNLVGEKILSRNKSLQKDFTKFHFGEVVAAACLAHDIGNPPFGHSGEDAISEYFKKGNGKYFEPSLSEKQWSDLTKFEGNAQGFRILTRLQNPNIKGGLRLTCATLAAFTKYPKESFQPKNILMKANKIYKKFGFFQSEKNLFEEVAGITGLDKLNNAKNFLWFSRHPLTFLVEAADDICYRIMDLEDGFRLGLLSFGDTQELLMPFIKKSKLKNYNQRDENDKIGYLRAKAISNLVNQLAESFLNEEKNILSGKFETDLISILPSNKFLETIEKISIKKIYSYESVVEREAAGYEVLGGLLDAFINSVNEASEKNISPKSKTLLKLLPNQFGGSEGKPEKDLYLRLLSVIDFVSGMTDSFAVSLFRKIKGISLPGK